MKNILRKRKVNDVLPNQYITNVNQFTHTKKGINMYGEVEENHTK